MKVFVFASESRSTNVLFCREFADPNGASGDILRISFFFSVFFGIKNSQCAAEKKIVRFFCFPHSRITICCTIFVDVYHTNRFNIFAYHVITFCLRKEKNYANWWQFNKTSPIYVKCLVRAMVFWWLVVKPLFNSSCRFISLVNRNHDKQDVDKKLFFTSKLFCIFHQNYEKYVINKRRTVPNTSNQI